MCDLGYLLLNRRLKVSDQPKDQTMTRHFKIAAALLTLASPAMAESHMSSAVLAGADDFRKCKSCHEIADGGKTIVTGGKTGPNLFGVLGRRAGSVAGFKYGDDLVRAGEAGLVWNEALLAEYIQDPRTFLQDRLGDGAARSRMSFKLRKGAEDVAAYLGSF